MTAGLATLAIVILVAVMAFRQAHARNEWSWIAFAWTLLLVLAYAAVSVGLGMLILLLVGNDRPLTALLGFLLPIAIGIVPVARIARRIKLHYMKPPAPR